MAAAELRRFCVQFGAGALIDSGARAYRDAGLGYLRLDEDQAFVRLLSDQQLLRLPLIRAGQRLSVGPDEEAWREWLRGDAQ
jgi:arsenate reductase-like glutaredoxin family protein